MTVSHCPVESASGLQRAILAALSGVLLALSFPKFGHGAVALIALAPLVLAVNRVRLGRALLLGYLSGTLWALGTLYWTALVVVQYGGLGWAAGVAVMMLLCLVVASFPALFAAVVALWTIRLGPAGLLATPFGWVATEALRGLTFVRFPWLLLGDSQHDNLPLVQLAAYTSVHGLSFVVAGVSAVIAYVVIERRSALRLGASVGAMGLLLAAWVHGSLVLSHPLLEEPRIRVGVVQASIRQEDKWDPALAAEHLQRHLELSREAAARGARLVVWPESAVTWGFDRSPALAAELRGFVRRERIHLLFGNDDVQETSSGEQVFHVGAKILTPEGALALRYHKIRLVPFGEYVPLRPLLTLGGRITPRLVRHVADFTPGDRAVVGNVDGGRLGATICYEAIFPDLVRRFTQNGADLLVNVTNDAWYGRTSAPYQHFAMARLRAVENGRYLVRAANTGISAVIDPRGRIVARTELFQRSALVEEVAFVNGSTFYAKHGDVFAWGCAALATLLTSATAWLPWKHSGTRKFSR